MVTKKQVGYKSDVTEADAQDVAVLAQIIFSPREFSTGSIGWNGNGKSLVKASGHTYRCQVSGNVILHKSKALAPEVKAELLAGMEAFTGNELSGVLLIPKAFKTGSVGFNASGKVLLKVAGKAVPCQVAVNMTAVHSKEWPETRPATAPVATPKKGTARPKKG